MQILMSVLLVSITVILMLPVLSLLMASPVPVTRDTLEMVLTAWVSVIFLEVHNYYTMNTTSSTILVGYGRWDTYAPVIETI